MKNWLLLCFFALLSCGNKASNDEMTTTVFITSDIWTRGEGFDDDNGDGVFESSGEECDFDNHWTFLNTGKLKVNDGATVCDPDTPYNLEVSWELFDSDAKLRLFTDLSELVYQIEELDEHKFSLRQLDPKSLAPMPARLILTR